MHLLTWFNGSTQGLSIFRTGLAQYEGVQEGLGVFAEWAVGGLTFTRARLLAGRVVAVDAMLRGAGFVDCFDLLTRDRGFRPATRFLDLPRGSIDRAGSPRTRSTFAALRR